MGRKSSVTAAIFVRALIVLLCFSGAVFAQKTPKPHAAKLMVPDNPSEHPAPEQPIPYSHKQHLALGLQCKECHTNPEPGKLMTFPATERCMQCHVTIAKDKPSIQKLTQYSKSQQPITWVRVYTVLTGIQWSHRRHLEAGMKSS